MKILFVSACPLSAERLDLEAEPGRVRDQLRASVWRDQVEFVERGGITPEQLVELVSEVRPDILHFSGHGADGGIVLRDHADGHQVLRAGSLQRILEQRSIRLLVLNCCYSSELARIALLSVRTVVGTLDAIRDDHAMSFSAALYRRLGDGVPLRDAFKDAQDAVAARHGGYELFQLIGEDGLVFTGAGSGPDAAPGQLPSGRDTVFPGAPWKNKVSDRGRVGVSHELGSIHLHVDGPQADSLHHKLLRTHNDEGFLSEYAWICGFVPGEQRRDWPELYRFHTPGGEEQEELDFFSTTVLHHGPDLPTTIQWDKIKAATRDALVCLHDAEQASGVARGVVVELERVAGVVDDAGRATVAAAAEVGEEGRAQLLQGRQLLFKPDYPSNGIVGEHSLYELHFSLDVPKAEQDEYRREPPVTLEQLNALSQRAGAAVGGWFIFQDARRWAYRSNGFEHSISADELAERWRRLKSELDRTPAIPSGYRLRLLAEESLAVWKSPLNKVERKLFTVPELARWERHVEPLHEFWVVTPQFLGDNNDEVREIMLYNMRERDVNYLYFLRSNADARRWLNFKRALADRLARDGEPAPRMEAYVLEFDDDFWASNMAFIAHAPPESGVPARAMLLRLDRRSKRIFAGTEMETGRVNALCQRIAGPLREAHLRRWEHVADRPRSGSIATLSALFSTPLDDADADRFDILLAETVSRNQGEIVDYQEDGVVVAFQSDRGNVVAALRCAADIVERLRTSPALPLPLLGIDAGEARVVVRADGAVWKSPAVQGCRQVARRHAGGPAGTIHITEAAARLPDIDKDVWPDLRIVPAAEGTRTATVGPMGAAGLDGPADTLAATGATPTADGGASRRAAILIGIDRTGKLPRLEGAAKSAVRMYDWARSQRMDAQLLIDADGPVRAAQVQDAIRKTVEAGLYEQLVVYFAGHGMNLLYGEYWLLSQAPEDPQAAVNVLGSARLAAYCGIPHVVFISDACRTAADTVQAHYLTGSVIFPNTGRPGVESPVDLFYACTLGRPAYEIRAGDGGQPGFAPVYTEVLLRALQGETAEAVEWEPGPPERGYVRPRALKHVLAAQMPAALKRKGLAPAVFQVPDAHIASNEGVFLSQLDGKAPLRLRGEQPQALEAPRTLAAVSAALLRAALDSDLAFHAVRQELAASADPQLRLMLDAAGELLWQHTAPQDACRFIVHGTTVAHALAPSARVRVEPDGRTVQVGIDGTTGAGRRHAAVLLAFADGRGVLLPAIAEHAAVLSMDAQGELVDVAYEPLAGTARQAAGGPHWPSRQRLRALAAVFTQAGPLRCGRDDAERLLARTCYGAHVDPSLALYAAYADAAPGRRERVVALGQALRRDLGASFLDLDLLVFEPGTPPDFGTLLLPFPARAAGWATMPALGIALPADLTGLERWLANSPWTLFTPEGVRLLRNYLDKETP